jgi:CheY-like chemotaxis protein
MGNPEEARRLRAAGFDAYLNKPVRQSELYDCLANLVRGEAESPTKSAQPEAAPQVLRGEANILLAEDNLVNQKVALKMLERLGCRADVADNGQKAIEALGKTPYDLVFMDVQMPVMDGLEATQRIRSGQGECRNPEVPIIAMTAHAMKGDKERCLEAGMNDYISKPVKAEELVRVLDAFLSGADTQSSPSAE